MALKRGFKAEANALARDMRGELGLAPHEPLSPWRLAEHLFIPIVKLSSLRRQIPEPVGFLMNDGVEFFSAATVFVRRRRTILHNDANSRSRQASDIAHEVGHALLQHPPTPPFCEHGNRHFDKDIDDEASWLGFALLISDEAALHIVRAGWSISVAAREHSVSADVVRMRINVTGARRRARNAVRGKLAVQQIVVPIEIVLQLNLKFRPPARHGLIRTGELIQFERGQLTRANL